MRRLKTFMIVSSIAISPLGIIGSAHAQPPQACADSAAAPEPEAELQGNRGNIFTRIGRTARRGAGAVTGEFSIKTGPHMPAVSAQEVCRVRAASTPVQGVTNLADQTENRRGSRPDIMELARVEALLRAELDRNARAWPHQPLASRPRIMFEASPLYNAYALADNTIVISLGLLEAAESDSELRFVIAHEYAHLLMGHHFKREQTDAQRMLVSAVTTGAQVLAVTSQLRMRQGAGAQTQLVVNDEAKLRADVSRAQRYEQHLRFAVDRLFEPGWNRAQEDEADVLALDLMLASGVSVDSYDAVFDKLHAARGQAATVAQQMETEATQVFRETLTPENISASVQGGTTTPLMNTMVDSLKDGITRRLRDAVLGWLNNSHRPPEKRKQGVGEYFLASYPSVEPPEDDSRVVDAIKSAPEFSAALRLRARYEDAKAKDLAGDSAGAMAVLQTMGAGARGQPSFVYALAARIAARNYQNSAAKAYYARALAAPLPAARTYIDYAALATEMGEHALARSVIDQGERSLNDPPYFYPARIKLALAQGDQDAATALKTQCRALAVKREGVWAQCLAEFPDPPAQSQNPFGSLLSNVPRGATGN